LNNLFSLRLNRPFGFSIEPIQFFRHFLMLIHKTGALRIVPPLDFPPCLAVPAVARKHLATGGLGVDLVEGEYHQSKLKTCRPEPIVLSRHIIAAMSRRKGASCELEIVIIQWDFDADRG